MRYLNILSVLAVAVLSSLALQAQGILPNLPTNNEVDYSKRGDEVIFVPDGVTQLGEKLLPMDSAPLEISMNMPGDETRARGMRLFAVAIKPGQTLRATLRAMPLSNYMFNWTLPADRSDPFYSRIKLAIDNQITRRAPTISFRNTTQQPYTITIVLTGPAAEPYSIRLDKRGG